MLNPGLVPELLRLFHHFFLVATPKKVAVTEHDRQQRCLLFGLAGLEGALVNLIAHVVVRVYFIVHLT